MSSFTQPEYRLFRFEIGPCLSQYIMIRFKINDFTYFLSVNRVLYLEKVYERKRREAV